MELSMPPSFVLPMMHRLRLPTSSLTAISTALLLPLTLFWLLPMASAQPGGGQQQGGFRISINYSPPPYTPPSSGQSSRQQQQQHYQQWQMRQQQQQSGSSQEEQQRRHQQAQLAQQMQQKAKQDQYNAIVSYQRQLESDVFWENYEDLQRVEREIAIDQEVVADLEKLRADHLGWWNWLTTDNALVVGQMAGTISTVCETVFSILGLAAGTDPWTELLSTGYTSIHSAVWTGRLTPDANAKHYAQARALDILSLKLPVFDAAKNLASVLKHAQEIGNMQNEQRIYRRDFKDSIGRLERAIKQYNDRLQYNRYQERYLRLRDAKIQSYMNLPARVIYFLETGEHPYWLPAPVAPADPPIITGPKPIGGDFR